MTEMKFMADVMLGRLAKWLRILGYDTAYIRNIRDTELIRLSLAECRMVLTRDTRLIKKKGVKNYLFITDDHFVAQLKQVVSELHIPYSKNTFSRCIICNEHLLSFSKDAACNIVPEYVCKTEDIFGRCPECHRIYWKGTHYKEMERILRELFG